MQNPEVEAFMVSEDDFDIAPIEIPWGKESVWLSIPCYEAT